MARNGLVSVRDHDELKAVVLGMRALDRDARNQVNRQTRANLSPIWTSEVERRLTSPMDRLVLGSGTRVKPGNPPSVLAAQATRGIGKGRRLVPAERWPAWEFGATDDTTTYERRSKRGGTHKVTRHTARQVPRRTPKGRVLMPALRAATPRLNSLWVQTYVRTVIDVFEGRNRG